MTLAGWQLWVGACIVLFGLGVEAPRVYAAWRHRGRLAASDRRSAMSEQDEAQLDVVADCETAGVVDGIIRNAALDDKAAVRTHPWLPPGQVFVFNRAAMRDWWPPR